MSNRTGRTERGLMRRLGLLSGRLWKRLTAFARRLDPGPIFRRGAVIGAFLAVLLFMAVEGAMQFRTGWGVPLDMTIGVVIAALTLGAVTLVGTLVLRLARRVPLWFVPALIAALFAAEEFGLFHRDSPLLFVLVPALLGGALAVASRPSFNEFPRARQVGISLAILVSSGLIVLYFAWRGGEGTTEGLVEVTPPQHAPVPLLSAPDPGESGPYAVLTLTYGSGEDRRPEFGEEADLVTEPVNGKPFVNRLSGWKGTLRDSYWGFDREELPLNGRVWHPDGEGPFPLVLVVHGNHSMRDYSDPGYGYLGEHLASRGFILVSVDENFINGDWTANYSRENDARGWLLLEHLRQWREWSGEEGNPFAGRVDMSRIVLMGHSRGGEAVAVAAAFNRLAHYPDDARVDFDYGFDIRGIVAIAPVDGQYLPAERRTPLSDVDYLLLHGSHDGDVSSFSGDRQFKRIAFTGETYHFKTSIYVYRANHGQFNTVWGDSDYGATSRYILNRAALLEGEEQRQVAKVYIAAFLETVLHGGTDYLPLFGDYRVGLHWLPDTYYINRFADSRTSFVADFDEDIDVRTIMAPGGVIATAGLATWREEELDWRGGRSGRENQVVHLGWRAPADEDSAAGPAWYEVQLPAGVVGELGVNAGSDLLFSLADNKEEPARPLNLDRGEQGGGQEAGGGESSEQQAGAEPATEEQEGESEQQEGEEEAQDQEDEEGDEDEDEDEEGPVEPLDFTVEVEDAEGNTAALPLSQIMQLMPPLRARITRYDEAENRYGSDSEPVLQSFSVPLERFSAVNPAFRPQRIRVVRFRFDRTEKGVVIVDEVGFRPGAF